MKEGASERRKRVFSGRQRRRARTKAAGATDPGRRVFQTVLLTQSRPLTSATVCRHDSPSPVSPSPPDSGLFRPGARPHETQHLACDQPEHEVHDHESAASTFRKHARSPCPTINSALTTQHPPQSSLATRLIPPRVPRASSGLVGSVRLHVTTTSHGHSLELDIDILRFEDRGWLTLAVLHHRRLDRIRRHQVRRELVRRQILWR